ncbi:hypothetical protein NDI44_27030 [Trichocoleus sp. DQ-A3]|uniref:hypothetical protein n=1 Tax=Cyanophyceae TaxID=3028117 RepID=UPI001681E577|nr:hypothetical protein [Coleofasciculus sp. FACHB-125]MBD1903779.1 hypothetical protein [Coleofasciculus sp. FACHB-125]
MELNERDRLIDEILGKYCDLLLKGKTSEQAYDILVLQGYDKSLVDLCLLDSMTFMAHVVSEITSMIKRGLSPNEVAKALRGKGYPESLIKTFMEMFLNPPD